MVEAGEAPRKCKVALLGMTYKENCSDVRNSKVYDIITRLNTYGIESIVVDPWANKRDVMKEYGINLADFDDLYDLDCVIVAVAHNEFKEIPVNHLTKMYRKKTDAVKVIIDVKGIYNVDDLQEAGMSWWRL